MSDVRALRILAGFACVAAIGTTLWSAPSPTPHPSPAPVKQKTFASPEQAAEAIVVAAGSFDVEALKEILGPDGVDLVVAEDQVQSKNQSEAFAAQARQKMSIVRDKANPKKATLVVGADDWPMPIPIVQTGSQWMLDTKSGRQEILYRRIGRNELDAIEVCHGYVEAQNEYAQTKHDGAIINQYAQKIVSTAGKHDGLAWQAPDGTWEGPVGEGIARIIAEGYADRLLPYHGYYFKVLKGQGPSAPMGTMDYVVKGAMIGGFALAATPADYRISGIKSFIVSHDGIVYEKDLGSKGVEQFRAMTVYDPDKTWHPVKEQG